MSPSAGGQHPCLQSVCRKKTMKMEKILCEKLTYAKRQLDNKPTCRMSPRSVEKQHQSGQEYGVSKINHVHKRDLHERLKKKCTCGTSPRATRWRHVYRESVQRDPHTQKAASKRELLAECRQGASKSGILIGQSGLPSLQSGSHKTHIYTRETSIRDL